MSLKIEQRLDNNYFTESEPRIYSTGVYLVPLKITSNGNESYVWVVDDFHDDTFDQSGKNCSPNVYGNSIDDLINSIEKESENFNDN